MVAGVGVLALDGARDAVPSPEGYFVDAASRGGECEDKRRPQLARSPETPWCSLARAAAAAPDGSRVWVRAGRYPRLVLEGVAKELHVRPHPGERVVLGGLEAAGVAGLRVEGFHITRGVRIGPDSHSIEVVRNRLEPSGVTLEEGSTDVLILGNRISSPKGSGVHMSSAPGEPPIAGTVIRGNHFQNIGATGVNARGFADLVVDGNEFQGVHSHDGVVHPNVIRTYGGGTGLVVARNFIHDNQAICFFIKDGLVKDVRFENNVVVRNRGYGFQVYDVEGLTLVNNTIVNNLGGVLFRGSAPDVTLANNVLGSLSAGPDTSFEFADYNYIGDRKVAFVGAHDLTTEPAFVAPAELDYRPRAGSPAIDAGTARAAPAVDHVGKKRSGVIDLGAYER